MNLHQNISPEKFEDENVHKTYNIIHQQFSDTRFKIWNKVKDFLNMIKPDSLIADIGCGNGKNMGTRDDCNYIGVDICDNLIRYAKKKKNCNYILGDCLNIPIKSGSIDYVLSIAVLHHLSTENRRIKALKEISRILKSGGISIIYVWSFEQSKFKNELSQDINVKWNLQKKYTDSDENKIYNRYYHLFKKNELDNLILSIAKFKIIESGFQCNNWYCIIKKI